MNKVRFNLSAYFIHLDTMCQILISRCKCGFECKIGYDSMKKVGIGKVRKAGDLVFF